MAITTKKIEKSDSFIDAKKAKAERRREKLRSIESKFKGGDEPIIDPFDYTISMIKYTNWCNLNMDNKEYRKYVQEHLINTERKKIVPIINKASDAELRSLSFLCRLKTRGQFLEDRHEKSIENIIDNLLEIYGKVQDPIPVVKAESKPKVDKTRELAIQFSDEIEGAIDTYVKTKKSDFDVAAYLKANEIASPVAKEIGSYYNDMVKELENTLVDSDAAAYYSNFTKAQMKKFIAFIQSIVNGCNQRVVSAKVSKPRVKKPVPATKIVAKVKYKKEFPELNLKSVIPTSLVDATEIWTYDTKYRKLAVYRAEKDNKLTIKGTKILGYDIINSIQVMLRKPEEFFKNTQLAKRALDAGIKTIKTKSVTPNGRMGDDTILLGAFK